MARLGWVLFVAAAGRRAFLYGRRWDFGGPYHLPRTLLTADGGHFPDGAPLDPLTRAVVASGREPEIAAGLLAVTAALFVLCLRPGQVSASPQPPAGEGGPQ